MMPPYPTEVEFMVSASGVEPLTYQWRCNGTDLVEGARILGTKSNVLTILNVQTNDEGSYSVVVSDPGGSVTSMAATLIWSPPPTTLTAGGVITIGVTFGTGVGYLAYLQVHISPLEAVLGGAGWRLQGSGTGYVSDPNYTEAVAESGNPVIECAAVGGWDGPTNRTVSLTPGVVTVVDAVYTRSAQLVVTPATGLTATGYVGGPFMPDGISYTLANAGDTPLDWWVAGTPEWVTVSADSGVMAGGESTNVTVRFNSNADNLPPGAYSGTLAFANLNNTLGNVTYPVNLLVIRRPPIRFTGLSPVGNGGVAMTLEGVPGRVYAIVGSSNLLAPLAGWTELLRLTNTTGQITFTNPPPVVSPQYYRAKEL